MMFRTTLIVAITLASVACKTKSPEERAADQKRVSQSSQSRQQQETATAQKSATAQPTGEPHAERPKKGRAKLPPQVKNAEKWNYPAVTWSQPQEALSRMKSENRPGLVVVKGEWCPHCRRYAEVFSDPQIAKLTESFELILLDNESEEAQKWQDTGTYVPRTLFLDPKGELDSSFSGPNPKFPHFFSSSDKKSFLRAMQQAASKYGS